MQLFFLQPPARTLHGPLFRHRRCLCFQYRHGNCYCRGTVWAIATADIAPAYTDSLQVTISNQDTTGPNNITETEKSAGFRMYPNPANDVLNLQITAQHAASAINIADLSGKIIIPKKVAANVLHEPQAFSLKHLASGQYIPQINGKDLNINKQFFRK